METVKNAEESCVRVAIELSLVPGVGTDTQNSIWKACERLTDLLAMSPGQLESIGVSPEGCVAIRSRRYRAMADEIMDWAHREGCRILVRGGDGYPPALREIPDPPLVIYC